LQLFRRSIAILSAGFTVGAIDARQLDARREKTASPDAPEAKAKDTGDGENLE